jgi:tRNA A-37 threonylcarbamoyl transferase component Bud32
LALGSELGYSRQLLARLFTGNVQWMVRPEYQEVLFGPKGLRLPEWLASGQATVVKQGPHRIVYRVVLPELRFFVKHNRIADRLAWVRQFLRPGKAWGEYQRALAVAARGVPTVEPLAVGVQGQGFAPGASYLITRSLDGAMQLNDFIEAVLPALSAEAVARLRCRLARALGAFIAQLHDAGILHHDLHCGNILIRLDEEDQPSLYLIDLQAVQVGQPLSWRRSRANLIVLNRWLMLRTGRTDRLRFWQAYLQARRAAPGLLPTGNKAGALPAQAWRQEQGRDLEAATQSSNERFWRRRERRYVEVNRHTQRLCAPGLSGYAMTDVDPALLKSLQADPDAPFGAPGARILKQSRSGAVVEMTATVAGVSRPVIYKRFAVTGRTDPLTALVRPSPALRSWLFGHTLGERCLPTARPLVIFHRRRWGLCWEGYLLMEKVATAGDLHTALAALDAVEAGRRRRLLRHWIDALARLVRELHQRHLAHRDLKAVNILLRSNAAALLFTAEEEWPARPPVESPFCFIDLVGASRQRRVRRKVRVKNLARLLASFCRDTRLTRTDKLRFLRVYLQWGLFGRQGWKDWWRALEQATQRKIRKNLRNQRPLA